MSPHAAANLMYGISLLCFDLSPLQHHELIPVHKALLSAMSSVSVGRFREAEREQILIYLTMLRTLLPHDDSTFNFIIKEMPIKRVIKEASCPSQLQAGLLSTLEDLMRRRCSSLQIEDEYSAFGGAFPIDAVVWDEEHVSPVAFIEVDGPHHFCCNGQLRRKDLLKESLYTAAYPTASFTRVRYDQVARLGCPNIAASVANFIALSKGCVASDELCSKRRAERELSRCLSGRRPEDAWQSSHSLHTVFADFEEDNS